MKKVSLFVISLFLALALGCTQGSDDETTIQITSTAALDEWVYSASTFAVNVGDQAINIYSRGFVSFDLSAIGSTITSAKLRLYQTLAWGDPYENLGPVVVDHVSIGGTLDELDFESGLLTSNIGTLSSNALTEWKESDVTEAVRRDYTEGRDDSQFRIRFLQVSDNDGTVDYVTFEDGENNRGRDNTPTLVVTYE